MISFWAPLVEIILIVALSLFAASLLWEWANDYSIRRKWRYCFAGGSILCFFGFFMAMLTAPSFFQRSAEVAGYTTSTHLKVRRSSGIITRTTVVRTTSPCHPKGNAHASHR